MTPAPSHAAGGDRVEEAPQEAAGAPHAPQDIAEEAGEAADREVDQAGHEASALDVHQKGQGVQEIATAADDATLAAEPASLEPDNGSQIGARSSDASFVATGDAGEPLTEASPPEVAIPDAHEQVVPSDDHANDRSRFDQEDGGAVLAQGAELTHEAGPIAAQAEDGLVPFAESLDETSSGPAALEAEDRQARVAPAEEQAAALEQHAEDSSWSESVAPGPDAEPAVPDASAERALATVVEEGPERDPPNIDVRELDASDPFVTGPAQELAGEPQQPHVMLDRPVHASPLPEPQIAALTPAFGPIHDQPAAPLREDQIWSGPEADDADPHGPRPERNQHLSIGAFSIQTASGGNAAASHALEHPTPGLAVLPSVSLPSRETLEQGRSYLRLAMHVTGAAVIGLTTTVLVLILLYRWIDPPTSNLMLGQRLLGTQVEQRWVPIERMSQHLVQAVILSEDGAFCRHRGVDWGAMSEAIESARGGSTITMQVVKNLFLWPSRSYVRKALEIALAYIVEVVWSKQRILEIYLNVAEWGPGVFGAEAAARNHFAKRASQLSPQEAALLAVSLPNPIERQAGHPGWQTRRLANNLLIRMRAARTPMRCVRGG